MCPGGGWNCGNPRVYGVDGDALVLPTCWALLALSPKPHKNDSQEKMPEKPGRALSLAWLQREFANIQSAGSLAVARMTLENYGIEPPPAKRELQDWSAEDLSEQGAHVLAWVCMALDPARNWPAPIRDLAPLSDSAILASRIADTNKFAAPSSFETQSPASQKTVPLKLTEGPAQ